VLQLPVLVGVVSLIIFFTLRLGPFDPEVLISETTSDPAAIERIRALWHLDEPITSQYLSYMGALIQGDFGRSFLSNQPVADTVAERLPATIELAVMAMLIGTIIGLTLGIAAAVWHDTWLDVLARGFGLSGISLPTFWLGLMLISVFSVKLGWFPVGGRFDAHAVVQHYTGFYLLDSILAGSPEMLVITLEHLALPALTLGLFVAGFVIRVARAAMIETLAQDYIRAARAKGLRRWTVVLRHGVRNASLPIATILGLQFGLLLGGAAVTETVFSYPGMGKLLIDSILRQDFPQIQASIIVLTIVYLIVNLLVDLTYGVLDPRIRTEQMG
jgi:ABC-type dipeptide/oligopeptide/nickel transport system permease component